MPSIEPVPEQNDNTPEAPTQFKVALTRSDLIQAAREYLFHRPNSRISGLLWILLTIVAIVGLPLRGPDPYLLVFLFINLAALSYAFLVMPRLLAGQIEKQGTLNKPTTWIMQRDAILLQSGDSAIPLNWDQVQDYIETPHFLLLTSGAQGRALHMIPLHAFETAAQARAFRQLLAGRTTAPKPTLTTGWSDLFQWAVLLLLLAFWLAYIFVADGLVK